ncbi:helix-turn-helix domain-containing protein [Gluconacetobacter tumulicola]|uniref:helix-turn-helix domain-containing protein n=1 Tax=Gluconacetobacter tumulicola TaxID=1017177 RepID=UPI0038D2098A
MQSKEVAARLGMHEHTVGKWRRRFVESGVEGLTDEYAPRCQPVKNICITQFRSVGGSVAIFLPQLVPAARSYNNCIVRLALRKALSSCASCPPLSILT